MVALQDAWCAEWGPPTLCAAGNSLTRVGACFVAGASAERAAAVTWRVWFPWAPSGRTANAVPIAMWRAAAQPGTPASVHPTPWRDAEVIEKHYNLTITRFLGEHGPAATSATTLCGWYFESESACPICGAVHTAADPSYHVATNDKLVVTLYCPCTSPKRPCEASAPCALGMRRCIIHRGLDVSSKVRLTGPTNDDLDSIWRKGDDADQRVSAATPPMPAPSMLDLLNNIRTAESFHRALEIATDSTIVGGGLFPSHYRADFAMSNGERKPRRVTRIAYAHETGLVVSVEYNGVKTFDIKCKRFERPTDAMPFEMLR